MNELLVAVFDSEDAAVKGMHTLSDLHQEGDISLYASALIVKGRDGNISVKQQSGERPLGFALGLLTGGIVGLLGGPAGSAVGASLGGYIGLLADWARTGIDLKFLDDVGKTLSIGKAAVLAEIEESWASLLEPRLREEGGIVFRRFRTDVVEDQLLQESKALQHQLEVLINNLDKANNGLDRENAANREALQKSIRDARQQLETIGEQANAAIDLKKTETDLKVKALLRQAETAAEDAKTRIQKRVADTEADFEMRQKKLTQARELAKGLTLPAN